MRAVVVIVLALTSAASASESVSFWGTWEPRPMLREFWRPVSEEWWSCNKRDECGPDLRLRKRCEEFARTHSPERAIPEIISDLFAFQSEANELVYLTIMAHWPRGRVVHALDSLRRSRDAGIREIAEETREDFLDVHK
jgi:hypothetical protein